MKKKEFSVTKAVKENARERVGQPRPSAPIPDKKLKQRTKRDKSVPDVDEA